MIENFESSSEYTRKLFRIDDKIIEEVEKESLGEKVPIITREVLNFMIFEANRIKAGNILEIGTATGFSGLFLARIANRNKGMLTTIEIDKERHEKAVENFRKAGLLERNNLILGDALEEIPRLSMDKDAGKFDFVFIDASKGQYRKFFEMCYELLSDEGTIFIDNIMFRGMVAKDGEDVPKRYRTIIKRLREFIDELNRNNNFILLPFGDGVGIVRK